MKAVKEEITRKKTKKNQTKEKQFFEERKSRKIG